MPSRPHCLALSLLSLLLATADASEVLQNLPSDAQGFVVINKLTTTDAKIQRLLKTAGAELPGPLAFFQAATGIAEGLDPQGDVLLAALPGKVAPLLAVWLPVQDYKRLIESMGGAADQAVAGITVAGEDVLVARHGRWALVMDPEQRELIERIVAGRPDPPSAVAEWNDWIEKNDVAVVALPGGVRAILAWAAAAEPRTTPPQGDDIFGFHADTPPNAPFAAAPPLSEAPSTAATVVQAQIHRWISFSPKLADRIQRARLIGCALRLDGEGNLLAGGRIKTDEPVTSSGGADGASASPPTLYQGADFVLHGEGTLEPAVASIVAGAYVRSLIDELTREEGMMLPRATVAQFQQTVEQAAAEVQSAVVLSQPGSAEDGIYTNDFLIVRSPSADRFADNAREVMRLWNSMNRDAEAQTRLVFDVEEVRLDQRTATQYSLDIAAADGAPELPEVRQAMEKLFGPGGKLRLWIAPVGDDTVLFAMATRKQVAAALTALDRKERIDWKHSDLVPVGRLLPAVADWRVFLNPHRYNAWHRREMEAITGPVIGGPVVPRFPPAPPIGIAGGFDEDQWWIEAAIPAETIKSAATYVNREK